MASLIYNSLLTTKLQERLGVSEYLDAFGKLSLNKEASKKLIEAGDTNAALLLKAVHSLLGAEYLDFEPETMAMELEKENVVLASKNRDKLLAAQALVEYEGFYWEYQWFHKTILAFLGMPVVFGAPQELSPCQLAEGIISAELVRNTNSKDLLEFDNEPQGYVAVMLLRENYVLAPPPLQFAEEALVLKLNKDAKELAKKLRDSSGDHQAEDAELEVQRALMAAPFLHLRDCFKAWQAQLPG